MTATSTSEARPKRMPQITEVTDLADSSRGRRGVTRRLVVITLWRYSVVMHRTPMIEAIHTPPPVKPAPTSRRSRSTVCGAIQWAWWP